LEIEAALLMASCLNEVMVNQLVSPSTQIFLVLSKRRLDEANLNEVIGKPS
jgi:hypothetical protein